MVFLYPTSYERKAALLVAVLSLSDHLSSELKQTLIGILTTAIYLFSPALAGHGYQLFTRSWCARFGIKLTVTSFILHININAVLYTAFWCLHGRQYRNSLNIMNCVPEICSFWNIIYFMGFSVLPKWSTQTHTGSQQLSVDALIFQLLLLLFFRISFISQIAFQQWNQQCVHAVITAPHKDHAPCVTQHRASGVITLEKRHRRFH